MAQPEDPVLRLLRMIVVELEHNRKAIEINTRTMQEVLRINGATYTVSGHGKRVYEVPKAPRVARRDDD